MSAPTSEYASEPKPAESHLPVHPATEDDESERNYHPRSPKFWAVMIGMYLSLFLVALDRMIIAVAIPAITNDFNSIEDIGWYGSAYMLTAASFNPVFGRIYQLYSTKWTFLASIIVFEVGSALCGAAPSSVALIVGRAIAGLGAAGIFSGGMMIIIPLVPLRKRPTYTAIFGMTFGVSSVLGPLVGGSFTDHVTWRWCFYINLPIGGFTILAIALLFNIDTSPKGEKLSFVAQLRLLDPIGVFFLIPSMVCLILALQWGGSTYTWSDPKIAGLLATFAILFVAFIIVEALTPETAMAPSRVVLNRSMSGSLFFVFLIFGSTMILLYFLSIWFQAVKGDSAMHAGISTIPLVLAMVIFGGVAAKFTEVVGYYNPSMLLSPVLCAVGVGMMSTMTRFSNHSAWIGYQVLFGLGLGCGFQQANLAAQNVLPRADIPLGMALLFFSQQISGSIFLAVGENVFSSKLVKRLSGVAGLDAETIVNTGATDIRKVVPPEQLNTVIDAYNYAITQVFIVAAILAALMVLGAVVLEWKSIKGEKSTGDASKSAEEKEKEEAV